YEAGSVGDVAAAGGVDSCEDSHRISMSGLPRLNDIHLGFVAKARQISFAIFPRRSELADIVEVFLHHSSLGPVDQRRSRRAALKMPRSRDATVSRVIMIPRR